MLQQGPLQGFRFGGPERLPCVSSANRRGNQARRALMVLIWLAAIGSVFRRRRSATQARKATHACHVGSRCRHSDTDGWIDPAIPEEVTFSQLLETNLVCTSSVLIRRSTSERLGGFNEDPKLISSE